MLITPKREHGIVFRMPDSMYGYQGWPTICKTDSGALATVCSGYRMQHICPFGKTVMNISHDEGKTWGAPVIINDSPLDDRDAGIVNLGKGRLLATWFCHPAEVYLNAYANYIKTACSPTEASVALAQLASYHSLPKEKAEGGSYIRISEDNGFTWGDPIKIPVSAPHGPNLLNDGSLLYMGKEMYSPLEKPGAVAVYKSKDGCTWERISEIAVPSGFSSDNFHEPHLLQLKNGRLLGVIRAQGAPVCHGFSIFLCYSDDGGDHWTTPDYLKTSDGVPVCGSPPHLMLHSSGAVVCSYGHRAAPFGERAVVSYDGGSTWENIYNIDDRASEGDLGYPASVELSDGSIYTVYYQRYQKDSKTSILSTRWYL